MLGIAILLLRRARRPDGGRALVGLAIWLAFQVHGIFDWSFGDLEVVNHFFLWTGVGLGLPVAERSLPPVPSPPTSIPQTT